MSSGSQMSELCGIISFMKINVVTAPRSNQSLPSGQGTFDATARDERRLGDFLRLAHFVANTRSPLQSAVVRYCHREGRHSVSPLAGPPLW